MRRFVPFFLAVIGLSAFADAAAAQSESVLYSFAVDNDGRLQGSALRLDKSGALYGTTSFSSEGEYVGAAFGLVQSGGVWSGSVLAYLDGDAGAA